MPTVIFRLKYPKADESIVMIDFSYETYRLRCSSGISLPPDEFKKVWVAGKNRLNPKQVHNENMRRLKTVKNIIEDYYESQLREGIVPKPETIRAHLQVTLNMTTRQTENEFISRFEEYITYKATNSAPASLVVYRQVLRDLVEFASRKGKTLTFKIINLTFIDEYVFYLQNRKNTNANAKKGLLNDSIHKRLSNLKAFMKWGLERGYHNNTQYERIKTTKAAKNEIVVLSEYELSLLQSSDLSARPALDRVKDIFLFAIYTGQRWSDVKAFDRRDLKRDLSGQTYWEFTAVKTKKLTRVPFIGFCGPALAILQKYDYQLPMISQQKFNEHLKQLGKLLGIDEQVVIKRYSGKKLVEIVKPKYEFISSHMARRTAVTILLQRGMPPTTIMKLTGHSELATLMKYERTGADALSQALEMAADRKEVSIKKIA